MGRTCEFFSSTKESRNVPSREEISAEEEAQWLAYDLMTLGCSRRRVEKAVSDLRTKQEDSEGNQERETSEGEER